MKRLLYPSSHPNPIFIQPEKFKRSNIFVFARKNVINTKNVKNGLDIFLKVIDFALCLWSR
jgi:hypothetical protein